MTGHRLHPARLEVETDHGAFPVWAWFTDPARGDVHGNVPPAALGISNGLARALQDWADWHDRHQSAADRVGDPASDDDWRQWDGDGAELARRLAAETGAEVAYRPRAGSAG